ncbi:hypothetical protein TI10_21650 [Photorhabdus luminescens subsp. luminescens]|uniref:Immunity protein 52 n=1 Tax=Photorhabdus luminescens TaxID=29488 RepID=A0A1G5R7J0_PHOLU|nr:immunity 52 family protein [Photorhabdus luminescens]KMW71208.1 hypothetical protein TI10_21650 [Photorhabdus luminescens subsp. luminescens]SCZ70045.1 Immunity protein 52 [Photorhabdus luminescens]
MNIIHARIEMFYDLKEKITPELALDDTYCIMQQINKVSNSSSRWNLPGYDLDEIKENNVFDESGITEYAINQFKESYDESFKSIIKTLFDIPGDVKLKNRIMYSSRDYGNRLGKTDVSIDLNFEKEKFNYSNCIDFVAYLVSNHYSPIIMMDAREYSLKQKQAFPDRVYAGWMLYLPIEIDPTLVPMAEEIISISDKNDKKGSLIITTKDIFDIENQEHINKANDIEICLRSLQILPLIIEI